MYLQNIHNLYKTHFKLIIEFLFTYLINLNLHNQNSAEEDGMVVNFNPLKSTPII